MKKKVRLLTRSNTRGLMFYLILSNNFRNHLRDPHRDRE